MACLGRPFSLGMLYDCRKDQIVPAMTLWNHEKLHCLIKSTPQVASNFEVICEDTLHSKALNLDISGNLELSIIGGLCDVSGSAEYLNDRKSSKQQSRVSLKYWSTSRFVQLTMDQLGNIEYPQVITNNIATHVVVGVLYGADAFFIFDRMVNISEVEQEVLGEIKALVQILPVIKGQGELAITKKAKEICSKLECKFYGDLKIPKNPATFEDAVKVYQQLPEFIKETDSPVPKKVWLYPLSNFNNAAAKVVHNISVSLVNQAEAVLEELLECTMQCNDIMKIKGCSSFASIQTELSDFKGMIMLYRREFSTKLAHILPSIREDGTKESQLADMFSSKEASPFCSQNLNSWLKNKMKEVRILAKYYDSFQSISCIEIALLPGDLETIVINDEENYFVCFCFQMFKPSDAKLEEMRTFLHTQQYSGKLKEVDSWSKDKNVLERMRKQFRKFTAFERANEKQKKVKFIVADISDQEYLGTTNILLYKNGEKKHFDPPTHPGVISADQNQVSQNSITLEWPKPEHGYESVQHYIVYYGQNNEGDSINNWKTLKTTGNDTFLTVNNLLPGTPYCFKVCAECEAGVSEFSKVSSPVFTQNQIGWLTL